MPDNPPHQSIPTVLVIFGATGDLMSRKILPALFHLFERGQLPPLFSVIGFARHELSDTGFRAHIVHSLKKHTDERNESMLASFAELFFYQCGFFEKAADYRKIARHMGMSSGEWKTCSSRLFYLAVPPKFYEQIFRQLVVSNLSKPCSPAEGFTRLLVEKPFGTNLAEAEKLDRLLDSLFLDEQVYRIDHYLAKEALQNILLFRFSNNLLERSWDKSSIEKIEIKLLESIDVEGRGSFYDDIGALLDVGQNHLLQMLALVTLEHPLSFSQHAIHDKRAEILERLYAYNARQIQRHTVRGQYAGYQNEQGVKKDSQTETYFRLTVFLDDKRWRNVPIILESGKKFSFVQKEIIVTFRHPSPCLCPQMGPHHKNTVHFRIQPSPGITIRFWAKKQGKKNELEQQEFPFHHGGEVSGKRYVDEYAQLLLDALYGDQTLFVTSRETIAGWKFIDPVVRAWQEGAVPLHPYEKDEILTVSPVIKFSKSRAGGGTVKD